MAEKVFQKKVSCTPQSLLKKKRKCESKIKLDEAAKKKQVFLFPVCGGNQVTIMTIARISYCSNTIALLMMSVYETTL